MGRTRFTTIRNRGKKKLNPDAAEDYSSENLEPMEIVKSATAPTEAIPSLGSDDNVERANESSGKSTGTRLQPMEVVQSAVVVTEDSPPVEIPSSNSEELDGADESEVALPPEGAAADESE